MGITKYNYKLNKFLPLNRTKVSLDSEPGERPLEKGPLLLDGRLRFNTHSISERVILKT